MAETSSRYSDRFFREPTPPSTPDSSHGDIAEVGDDHNAPKRRSGHQRWQTPVAIAVAFVLGASGGAYGWNRWRDHTTVTAAQSAIELTTVVTTALWTDSGFQASLEFINAGAYEVHVSDPRFVDGAVIASAVPPFAVPAGSNTTQVVPLSINCAEVDQPATWRPAGGISVDVETADGSTRRTTLDGTTQDGVQLAQLASSCIDAERAPEMYLTTIDATTVRDPSGAASVVSHIRMDDLGSFDQSTPPDLPVSVQLDGVFPGRGPDAFRVTTDPVLPTIAFAGQVITVTWSVGTCSDAVKALEDDMTLSFTGHAVDSQVQGVYSSDLTSDLAIALVRLAEQQCR